MIHFNNNCKVDPTLGVSVFAEVRPDGGTASLSICQEIPSENAFRHFMDSLLSAARQRGVYPDNWIFQYDMPAGRRAVAAVRETDGRFTDFHRFMRRAGIAPIRILSLRDAAYCQEQDIDCLSPEGLRGRLMTDPAYRRFLDSDRIYAGHQTPDTLRTTRAIDIGAGMLLYDLRHPIGREAYKSFMQHCADHFFEQELNGLDKISLYDIHCFFDPETYLSKLGALNFNPVYFGRNFRLDNLNGKMLFDRTMRYEGIFLKEYDMRPLSVSFVEFIDGERIRVPVHSASSDIAFLDRIVQQGYPPQRPSPDLRIFSPSLERFQDIEERIASCADPDDMPHLQRLARQRAQEILDTKFPKRRTMDSIRHRKDLEVIPSWDATRNTARSTLKF